MSSPYGRADLDCRVKMSLLRDDVRIMTAALSVCHLRWHRGSSIDRVVALEEQSSTLQQELMYASNSLMDAQKHLTDNCDTIEDLERQLANAKRQAGNDRSMVSRPPCSTSKLMRVDHLQIAGRFVPSLGSS
jgi:hypothetical protein